MVQSRSLPLRSPAELRLQANHVLDRLSSTEWTILLHTCWHHCMGICPNRWDSSSCGGHLTYSGHSWVWRWWLFLSIISYRSQITQIKFCLWSSSPHCFQIQRKKLLYLILLPKTISKFSKSSLDHINIPPCYSYESNFLHQVGPWWINCFTIF
jgi:hypothetical protein